MKNFIIIIFFLLISFQVSGQQATSNGGGDVDDPLLWSTPATWEPEGSPNEPDVDNDGNVIENVAIYGFVLKSGNLQLGNRTNDVNLTIEENSILRINGDYDQPNRTDNVITVKTGGLLIIDGALLTGNRYSDLTINNFGTIVVTEYYDDPSPFYENEIINNEGATLYIIGDEEDLPEGVDTQPDPDVGDGNGGIDPEKLDDFIEELIGIALPITLHSFTYEIKSKAVQLNWVTAMELNFDHFTIERSADAVNFDAIGTHSSKVEGNSDTQTAYDFTDIDPLVGQSYYRLKATDIDGTVEYHEELEVWYEDLEKPVVLFPNPVPVSSEVINLIFSAFAEGQVEILDAYGRIVFTKNFETDELKSHSDGFHFRVATNKTELKRGMYTAKTFQNGGRQQIIRFIVR
ncbi:T9SS type A sorting domain-containing protein [Xanthovirga aplysinae]|uniref:T9SS type A sorting domain-containing protein n=1 Tax=Xanthovirga aplysinae TaxID=2529853 RepID=UPI0012BCBF9C|nr:T9SS type A sorting domain-containing protein [Xanthovirga aplysinae]MTI31248.1 T9SS type A sorting domain-containing protein [Xanthovirga aplysinae]